MPQSHLKNIIARLPDSPGIYKYYDVEGSLLYIGKAKSLKKRVSSYFLKTNQHNRKTLVLVSKIADIQVTLVDTEYDALLLENALIKKFQPRYNINLKDDKTYPFIAILNERFPRIIVTRRPDKNGSEYFGPYASGLMMHAILDLIKALFTLRNCNYLLSDENIKAGKFRPCLEFQIGNCKAPCVLKQTEEEYNLEIAQIRRILKGNISDVKRYLKEVMLSAASELRFEEADLFKKRLELLENYQSKSTIVSHTISNVDVFTILSDEKLAFVNYLKVMNGIVVQTQTFELRKKMDESDDELLSFAIAETRERYSSNAKELILPFDPGDLGNEVTVTIPKAGDKKKLLDLSMKNVMFFRKDKLSQYEKLDPELKIDRLMEQMKKDLHLKIPPKHIECFDNSNIQGAFPVSAMVVFKNGKASKKDYRHFNVKTVVGPNDFDTMKEVITRRYGRLLEENLPLPDLIVVDGGKGQLSSAVESLKKLKLYGQIPIIGIAKRLEEIYYPGDELPLFIDKKSETLKVIQQMRDEAHRFGITHHRKRRINESLVSELEQIQGIGEESVRILLSELKSVKQIKSAKLEVLEKAIGVHKASLVWKYFNSSN